MLFQLFNYSQVFFKDLRRILLNFVSLKINLMQSLEEKASYGVGMSIGESLKNQQLEHINVNMMMQAIQAVFNNETTALTVDEANIFIQQYLDEKKNAAFGSNKSEGEAFLAENAKKEGIHQTFSGLQYEILTAGEGAKPSATDNVTVHYHGTLIDGTVFDSSMLRGTPATFGVHQVIPGWTEALQLMSLGSKFRLYIPQELSYGANPHPGGPIQPFSALIFEVELLNIN
jgi:FKBP-type peptidyl-prolyl cis-trans isomerase FklB